MEIFMYKWCMIMNKGRCLDLYEIIYHPKPFIPERDRFLKLKIKKNGEELKFVFFFEYT